MVVQPKPHGQRISDGQVPKEKWGAPYQEKNGGLLAKTSKSIPEDNVKAGVVIYESWGQSQLVSRFECLNREGE